MAAALALLVTRSRTNKKSENAYIYGGMNVICNRFKIKRVSV